MKMQEIEVSDEYLDTLCEWMMKWVENDESLVIPQFLKSKGIGYHYFKYFIYRSPKVKNTYEVMKATLCSRWVERAMKDKNMPQHQAKVLMRYLNLYDTHGRDLDDQSKKAIAEVEKTAELNYIADNYGSADVTGIYKGHYEVNANKRRSGEKVK